MSTRYPGGLISRSKPVIVGPVDGEGGSAPGVWTLEQASYYIKQGTWPLPNKNKPLYSWGSNYYGQLGQNDVIYRSSPVQVGSLVTWSSISGGARFFNAIRSDGTMWSWGINDFGQLGISLPDNTTRSSPVQIGAETIWSKNTSGNNFVVAIKTDNSLWSWGRNVVGQLGTNNKIYRSSPVQVGAETTWLNSSAMYSSCIAIKTNGTLWGWGGSSFGQLGNNNTIYRSSPTQIGSGTTWLNVACGEYHALATQSSGTLWAWGRNNNGQLGDGTATNRSSPVQVGALTTWSSISAVNNTSFSIKTDGTLWAWGKGDNGQLGTGVATNLLSPVQVGSLTTWSKLSAPNAKAYFFAAIQTDGTLWSWGYNFDGQLGQNNTISRSSPVQVGTNSWYKVAVIEAAMSAIGFV